MSSTGRAKDRQPDDFYETPAWATDAILPYLNLTGTILEPAAGHGAIAERLLVAGVMSSRITLGELDAERANTCAIATGLDTHVGDFLSEPFWAPGSFDLVITNPPYMLAEQFIRRARTMVNATGEVVMLLRLNFLSGLKRVKFWQENPAHVFVLPKRPSYCVILRDVFRCARCKRTWKVPHEAGPFAVPVEEQCECGEIPAFKQTTKTANDSCEYGWLCWGPNREQRWDILELPATASKLVEGGDHARVHRVVHRRIRGHVHKAEVSP